MTAIWDIRRAYLSYKITFEWSMRAYCKCITKKKTSLLWTLENSWNPVHLFPGRRQPGKRICMNRFFIQSRSDVCEARHMTWVPWKEGRQIWSKLFSVQHLQASSNTSSSSGLNIFIPCEYCTDKWKWKNSDVFIRPGFEAQTSALYLIGDPSILGHPKSHNFHSSICLGLL